MAISQETFHRHGFAECRMFRPTNHYKTIFSDFMTRQILIGKRLAVGVKIELSTGQGIDHLFFINVVIGNGNGGSLCFNFCNQPRQDAGFNKVPTSKLKSFLSYFRIKLATL